MGKVRFLIVLAISLMVFGLACQDSSNLTMPQDTEQDLHTLGLPNIPIDSAIFTIYVMTPSGQTVNAHRITADWDESSVTWNSFSNAFDPSVEGSFLPNAAGFRSANVTALVQGWINGDYPNFGLLIEQGASEFNVYASSERLNQSVRPTLSLYYTSSGTEEIISIRRDLFGTVSDAHIWEIYPDDTHGTSDELYTGVANGYVKYTLLKFESPTITLPAAIGDRVWFDNNQNGIQDDGELGVPDAVVQLLDCNGNVLDEMLTDADGYYLFSDLEPGDYLIRFFTPEGYTFTLQDQGGDDAVDSDADATTGIAWCTTLESGETDLTWDAGIYMIPQDGCTLTIGYWKTHAGFGPQADMVTVHLPIWLGTDGGAQSMHVTDAQMAVDILSMFTYGVPSNGITKLYAQLLGAKLNIDNGADYSAVSATIASADAYLAAHSWTEWDSLSKNTKKMIIGWMSNLDDYNNGDIGPGHCD